MSLRYEVATTIDASPDTVWEVLTDTPKWPQWDAFTDRIEGEVALGNKVKAFSKLSPGRAFAVRVSELDAPKRMVWTGGMPLGLFTGVRTYTLEADGDKTKFFMQEVFSGPMLFMIKGTIPDMNEAFQSFADGLKKRSEGG